MKRIDTYEIRKEMVDMHDTYLNGLDEAIKSKKYIEASWLCYALFEQRTNRVIEKYIEKCTLPLKTDKRPTSITTRLNCIKALSETNYNGISKIKVELIEKILQWCKERNSLVHDLVRLDRHKKFDEEFKRLALTGQTLVYEFYKQVSDFRKWFQDEETELEQFPSNHCEKCRCNKQKCIKE